MYSLAAFGNMLTSQVRMDAYIEALRRTVTPTSVVIDLGSGTGIWSLLACRVGAPRLRHRGLPGDPNSGGRRARQRGFGSDRRPAAAIDRGEPARTGRRDGLRPARDPAALGVALRRHRRRSPSIAGPARKNDPRHRHPEAG